MFCGATTGASAAGITHILHHGQLCDILAIISKNIWEREKLLFLSLKKNKTKYIP